MGLGIGSTLGRALADALGSVPGEAEDVGVVEAVDLGGGGVTGIVGRPARSTGADRLNEPQPSRPSARTRPATTNSRGRDNHGDQRTRQP